MEMMIQEMDANKNGRVEYSEFLQLMEQKMQQQDTEETRINSEHLLSCR